MGENGYNLMSSEEIIVPLAETTQSVNTTMLSSIGISGKLENNAQMAVVGLGGPNDGAVTIAINLKNIGKYNFVINYFAGDGDRPLSVDVNGVNTGTIYMLSKTLDWNTSLVYTLPLNLTQKNNLIKFHGNGVNYGPYLGNIIIAPVGSTLPLGVYDLASNNLINGAMVNQNTGFVTNLGGTGNGMAIVSLGAIQPAKYILSLNYLSGDISRPLAININGISMGVYTLPKTVDWSSSNALVFTLPININKSNNNVITFSGISSVTAPDLGLLTLNVIPPDSPPGTFSIVGGTLENGAVFGTGSLYGYVTNLGGLTDGSSKVTFTVADAGLYNVTIFYKNTEYKAKTPTRYNQQPLKVDVNGVVMTTPYSIGTSETGKFTFAVTLISGTNTLKFHGDGINLAPNLSYFSIALATQTLPKGVFNPATGILNGGAVVDKATGFVSNLGGANNGSVIINNVVVSQAAQYGLVLYYLSGDTSRGLKVDINGMNTGVVYNVPKTTDWTNNSVLTYTIPVNLYSNNNSIKFYGNGTNPAPYLGKFTLVIMPPKPPAGTYSAANGSLQNNASLGVGESYGFATNLGGVSDGSSTVSVNAQMAGTYSLTIFYKNTSTTSLPLVVDVGDVKSTISYSVPPSSLGRFALQLNLLVGNNSIKFHGDGTNPAPDLSIFTLAFLKK